MAKSKLESRPFKEQTQVQAFSKRQVWHATGNTKARSKRESDLIIGVQITQSMGHFRKLEVVVKVQA